MHVLLILVPIVAIACIVLNKISTKLGIPMLLAFILLGMFFGSDGVIKIQFDDFNFSERICSTALIFIMFYGGFGTKWSEAKPVAVKSVLLSSFGVIFTAGLVGLFCHFGLHMDLLESFLIGAVISSTDAASVFSILRSKRLNLKYNTASMLEVESGSNDPASYMLTLIMLSIMNNTASGWDLAYLLFAQIAYGVLFGVLIALVTVWILKKFSFATDGFDTIFVFAIAILAYSLPNILGGNGYLSTYIVGIILGNSQIQNTKSLVHFFDGLTGLMQMLIFFLLGLLSFPSKLPEIFGTALAIALFLTFIARPISVFIILTPFKCKFNQQLLVAWSGLRGAASIVFAIMATINPAVINNDVFHIVFLIVLFSILLQGSLIPLTAKKLNMIDSDIDVLKTFTDYSEVPPIQFMRFTISPSHHWENSYVRDILFPPNTLLVMILRGNEKISPSGNTLLLTGDNLILCGKTPEDIENIFLSEIPLKAGHEWINMRISQISMEENQLIIMIKRKNEIIIPNGGTLLKENDLLFVNKSEL